MNTPKNLPEEFLQHIWENRLFHQHNLKTGNGETLEIIHQGRRNTDAGPDFFNAKIKIDDTIWAGNIEIHQKASDWIKHQHQDNKAYDNVILHVVESADVEIKSTTGNSIPVFTIQYPEKLAQNYRELLESKTWVPCQEQFYKVDPIHLQLGFNRLMIERLESKTQEILERLDQNKNDWNETFYQFLARMFGFKVNAVPFELLARSLPIGILRKHRDNLFQLEAFLFGSAGLLNKQLLGDDYFLKLRDEYSFLYTKYKLKAIESHLWRFLRLRPVNFPTIRISQLAALIHKSENIFSQLIDTDNLNDLQNIFRVRASEYWDTHYNFNINTSKKQVKELGDNAAQILIINVVIPFLFVYGEKQNKHGLKNRALDFLDQLPAEDNSVIRKWEELGVNARTAFETQALLQLKNSYCETKKCLNCHVGTKLIASIS